MRPLVTAGPMFLHGSSTSLAESALNAAGVTFAGALELPVSCAPAIGAAAMRRKIPRVIVFIALIGCDGGGFGSPGYFFFASRSAMAATCRCDAAPTLA